MAADQSSEKPGAADESLRLFLSRTRAREDPSAVYTFDGERGIARTVICREPSSSQPETRQRVGDNTAVEQGFRKSRQKDCLVLEMYSTQLFAAMQHGLPFRLYSLAAWEHRSVSVRVFPGGHMSQSESCQRTGSETVFIRHASPD
ncbi:hypothetical protein EDD15DRAFT_2201802 [Pisolithus albus]|nr:hypothetical protein EDD15DRAFT_2201802 [Pisolithus albus]